jgi:PAS domain S-box-containing protein
MGDLGTNLLWLGLIQLIMVALALLVVILESQKSRKTEYNFFALGMTFFFLHLLAMIFFAEPIHLAKELALEKSAKVAHLSQIEGEDATSESRPTSKYQIKTSAAPIWLVLNHGLLITALLLLAYSLILPKLMSPLSDSFAQFLRLSAFGGMLLCLAILLYASVYLKGPFQGSFADALLHLGTLAIVSFTLFTVVMHLPKLMLFLKVAFGMFLFSKLSIVANSAMGGLEPTLLFSEYGFECFAYLFIVMAVNQLAGEDLRVLFDQLKSRTTMLEDATRRLTKLNQLSTDLLQTTDISSLRERILDSIAIGMGFRYSFLLMLDNKEKFLRGWNLNETTGKPFNFVSIPVSSDSFLVDAFFKGKTFFFGESTRLPDATFMQNYQYSKNLVTIPLQTKKETYCWEIHDCDRSRCPIRTWSLPICWHAKTDCPYYTPEEAADVEICLGCPAFNIIGLLVIDNRLASLKIDEKNLPFIETFANQAGIALHNANLLDNLATEVNFREETFKNLPTGVIVIDNKGTIATINPAQEKILRLTREELIGRRFDQVRIVNDMPTLIDIVATTLKGGTGYEDFGKVWDLTHPNGILQLTIRVSPLPQSEDTGGGVIVLVDDVTDKLQLERQLFHSEKLATIGQMAAGIAHEVNNPLAGVSGFLQVIAARLKPDSPEKTPLDIALKSIERASNTIKDLLKFAKPPPSEKKLSNINQLIHDSLLFISYQPRYEKIKVLKDFDDDIPDAHVDPGQISQVLDNIIINALQAMGSEGTLRVSTGLSGNWVHVYITDNGPGIPPENIKRIFDPFFTTKQSGEGTGLGLSTCDRIINDHAGTIAVYSIEGKETTFIIRLPVSEQEMGRHKRRRMFTETGGKEDSEKIKTDKNPEKSDDS